MSRLITDFDLAASRQLKRTFALKKAELKLTQKTLGEKLGTTQSYVAQCMNGHVALDLKSVLFFAEALQCRPQNIDPNFDRRFPSAASGFSPRRIIEQLEVAGTFYTETLVVTSKTTLADSYAADEVCFKVSKPLAQLGVPAGARLVVSLVSKALPDYALALLERRNSELGYQLVRVTTSDDEPKFEGYVPCRGDRFYPISLIQQG